MGEDALQRSQVAAQPAFLMYGLFVVLQLTLAALIQSASVPFGLAFSEVFLFAAPVVVWCHIANYRPTSFLRLTLPRPALLGIAVAVAVANFLVAGTLQYLVRLVLPSEIVEATDLSRFFQGLTPFEATLMVVAAGGIAPFCEELAFRGYLLTVLGARYRAASAVVVTAGLFSLLHLDPVGLIARFELGVVFALLTLWARSLWPAVLAHATNNILASAIFFGSQNSGAEGEGSLLAVLGAASVSLVVTVMLLQSFRALSPTAEPAPVAALDPEQGHSPEVRRGLRAGSVALGTAIVTLGLFFAFDSRGAAVRFAERSTPSHSLLKRTADPEARLTLEERLEELRRQAYEGELSVEEYSALRHRLWDETADGGTLTQEEIERLLPPPLPDIAPQ